MAGKSPNWMEALKRKIAYFYGPFSTAMLDYQRVWLKENAISVRVGARKFNPAWHLGAVDCTPKRDDLDRLVMCLIPSCYVNIAFEYGHSCWAFQLWCSIVMLVYQRVNLTSDRFHMIMWTRPSCLFSLFMPHLTCCCRRRRCCSCQVCPEDR